MTGTTTALDQIAATDTLLVALDFDGTISPLINEPMKSRMLPEARVALDALTALPRTFVAIVSGRSLIDLEVIAEHTADSPIYLAGSHGAEFWVPGEGALEPDETTEEHELRDRLRAAAEFELGGVPGVLVEPKTFGFGIHTRSASAEDAERAHRFANDLVETGAPHWRRRTGHNIVEFSFRQEGKDAAIAMLRERTGATAVLFAGDDVTDEDAMVTLGARDVGVRVGDGATAASVRVADIPELVAMLSALATMRVARRQ